MLSQGFLSLLLTVASKFGIYFYPQLYLLGQSTLVGELYSMLSAQTKSIGSSPMLYGDISFLTLIFTSVLTHLRIPKLIGFQIYLSRPISSSFYKLGKYLMAKKYNGALLHL